MQNFTTFAEGVGEGVDKFERYLFAVGQRSLWVCRFPVASALRASRSSLRSVRWASEPQAKKKIERPYPGAVLEFTLFGLLVVCGLMSTFI